MINLTKPDQTATIDLSKGNDNIVVRARWIDNGDRRSDNDDLDLRCAILFPGEKMYWVDGDHLGSLHELPYANHHGDVRSASKDAPGEEIITVSRDIAKRAGGPVALCFSVYSAFDNGMVAVSTLHPTMKMNCGSQEVECSFDFNQSPAAGKKTIYTYVIGYAVITEDEVILAPSGLTSKPHREETPWLFWKGTAIDVEMVGPAVFKGKRAAKAASYNRNIPYRYENVVVPEKKGLLGGLFG